MSCRKQRHQYLSENRQIHQLRHRDVTLHVDRSWHEASVGTDSQRPFALVIVSGLFTRLLISVFLMPVLYTLVARAGDRLEV